MTKTMVYRVNDVSLDTAEFDDNQAEFDGWVEYVPATHDPVHYPDTRIKGDFVNKDVFLFDLFRTTEQITLATQLNRINTQANWDSNTPTTVEGAYRALFVAEKQLQNVGQVDLSSDRVDVFLNLCALLQIFGPDTAEQARRITMIKYGIKP
jgi:hypothetical protein